MSLSIYAIRSLPSLISMSVISRLLGGYGWQKNCSPVGNWPSAAGSSNHGHGPILRCTGRKDHTRICRGGNGKSWNACTSVDCPPDKPAGSVLSATSGSTSSAFDGRIGARLTDFARRHFWLPLQRTIHEAYEKQYYPLGYSPALDGLRGIMTVGIIVAHTRYPLVPGTLLYMDMFFVMSGYFITSLLLRDIER
jgi:hypothetical protein